MLALVLATEEIWPLGITSPNKRAAVKHELGLRLGLGITERRTSASDPTYVR